MKPPQPQLFGYWLAVVLCVVAPCLRSQPLPFKGANTILITTDLADKEAYLAVAEVLTEQGIAFTGDNDFLIIRAPQNALASGAKGVVFEGRLYINSGLASLTGWLLTSTQVAQTKTSSGPKNILVEYQKGSASLQKEGFLFMDELAKKLQPVLHGIITYKLQPSLLLSAN